MAETSFKNGVGRSLNVLLVEDEFILAMDVQAMLEQLGHRVVGAAASVELALGLLRLKRPDIALLDANLNGRWSTPVAQALRAAGIPYILMSAYGATELQSAGLLDGSLNIGKPVMENRLVRALADAAR